MLMYVKLFASLYQGTLRGCSDEILVFTNLLAHADQHGLVDKHWRAISEETGLDRERVEKAISNLEAPDPESRSPEMDGRRIIRMDEHRAWGWQIVNYGKYRAIRSEDDRREQNRLAQERFRNKSKPRKPESAQGEAEGEAKEEKKKPKKTRLTALPDGFCISERVSKWATEKGHHHLAERLEQFVGYAKRSGKTYADWDEAFMSAIREDWAKLDGKTNGSKAPWWASDNGIIQEGKRLGLEARPGETIQNFKSRIEAKQ